MNRNRPDHKIYGLRNTNRSSSVKSDLARSQSREAGYTLVALLAVMTLLALFALAAAPSLQQQSVREREKEAIFRGEQVADAIRDYYIYQRRQLGMTGDQALPSSMDELLEGVPIPGGSKKRQILRVSASRDPLSESGEWGYVAPRSQRLIDFQESVLSYSGNFLPEPTLAEIRELQGLAAPRLVTTLGLDAPSSVSSGGDQDDDVSGPFVGVVSRNKQSSVLYYYGIDQHNHWIFTPLFRR